MFDFDILNISPVLSILFGGGGQSPRKLLTFLTFPQSKHFFKRTFLESINIFNISPVLSIFFVLWGGGQSPRELLTFLMFLTFPQF